MSDRPTDQNTQPRPSIRIHHAATLFPLMRQPEFQELLEDIRKNGVHELLILVGDSFETAELIDGRNRMKAIKELGLDPYDYAKLVQPSEIPDPISFVLSVNLYRRQLDVGQRAMVAHKLAIMQKGRPQSNASIKAFTQAEAAAAANVSRSAIQKARKISQNAVPGIVAAVEDGEIALSAAGAVSELPESEQQQLIDSGPKAVKAAASKSQHKSQGRPSSGETSSNPKRRCDQAVSKDRDFPYKAEKLPAFLAVETSQALQEQISSVSVAMEELAMREDGAWMLDRVSHIQLLLKQAKAEIRDITYASLCPKCMTKSDCHCTTCDGRGFLDHIHYAKLSQSDKKLVLEHDPTKA